MKREPVAYHDAGHCVPSEFSHWLDLPRGISCSPSRSSLQPPWQRSRGSPASGASSTRTRPNDSDAPGVHRPVPKDGAPPNTSPKAATLGEEQPRSASGSPRQASNCDPSFRGRSRSPGIARGYTTARFRSRTRCLQSRPTAPRRPLALTGKRTNSLLGGPTSSLSGDDPHPFARAILRHLS
jgi:hypothetical protein